MRKEVGEAIISGQTHSALALLEQEFPGVLSQVGGIAPLYICCQCFVDKVLRPPTAHQHRTRAVPAMKSHCGSHSLITWRP